jgi:hypothetical protein
MFGIEFGNLHDAILTKAEFRIILHEDAGDILASDRARFKEGKARLKAELQEVINLRSRVQNITN